MWELHLYFLFNIICSYVIKFFENIIKFFENIIFIIYIFLSYLYHLPI